MLSTSVYPGYIHIHIYIIYIFFVLCGEKNNIMHLKVITLHQLFFFFFVYHKNWLYLGIRVWTYNVCINTIKVQHTHTETKKHGARIYIHRGIGKKLYKVQWRRRGKLSRKKWRRLRDKTDRCNESLQLLGMLNGALSYF